MFGRLIGLVSFSAFAAVALAGPQTFAQRVQNIRAAVVILDSAKANANAQPQSAGPYALYNLDANTSIKPAGWNFYNPYAPTRLTPAIYSRWSSIDSTTPVYSAAAPAGISKRNAAYWEIFLSQTTDQVLANYDLLVVNPAFFASLNPTEQNRLRRFVDNGGVLWVDPAGMTSGVDPFNNFPLPFVTANPSGFGQQTDFFNSLMNSIQQLTPGDINTLDQASPNQYVLAPVSLGTMTQIGGGTAYDFSRLQPVSYLGANPSIAVGRIGEGAIVVTANGASLKLNRSQESTSYLANNGYAALDPILEQDGLAAAKLAINMVGLLRDSRQQASSSRKVSSSAIDVNPPLISTQSVTDISYSSTSASPALYKGLLVTTGIGPNGGVIRVYDASPSTDLDGDGNSDDGLQDFSLGQPHDEIWEASGLTGPLSAPVCAEVPGSGSGTPQDEVMFVDGNGNLIIYNLTPRNADGTLSGTAQAPVIVKPPSPAPSIDTAVSSLPIAPTVHEGVAYVNDNVSVTGSRSGRIWEVDLQTGAYVSTSGLPWTVGGESPSSGPLPEFSYSATVGYIPILDNSGGVDKVLYSPFVSNTNAGVNGNGFISLWIGAKGEVPSSFDPAPGGMGTDLQVTTRASSHGGLPIYIGGGTRGVKLTVIDSNGNPWSAAQMAAQFAGTLTQSGGVLTFPLSAASNGVLSANISGIRVDYNIDWGDVVPGALTSVERGQVVLPDLAQGPIRTIMGPVALSPQGTIYVVNSNVVSGSPTTFGPKGGGLYGFREQGVGLFNCVSRYELYDNHTEVLNQANDVNVPAVLSDYDTVFQNLNTGLNSILGNPNLSNFEFRGGASIRNGQVFVTAVAKKATKVNGLTIPATILMAFNAEPQVPNFLVGTLSDGFEILQADFARSSVQSQPENQSVLAGGSYTYDSTTGILSFPNLMNVSRGQIQNCLSLSQPIIIREPGKSDRLVYPDGIGGAVWNPLQWFHIIDGAFPSGGTPVVTGNSVFVSLDSYLPSVLSGNVGAGQAPATNGVLYAVNAQIPAASLHPLTVTGQPWINQLWTIDSSTPFTADPNIIWPQLSAATSFSDFQVKVRQTILQSSSPFTSSGATSSTYSYGVVAGGNAVASWGDTGLYTFAKANFLICDEGRIVEMDPSGNPIWSTDASASPGQSAINSSAVMKPLIRPVRAYHLTSTSVLFADPGANRVATVNTNGIEQRSIASFKLDPTVVPAGFASGEPLTLSGPRDVNYYTTYTGMSSAAGLVTLGDGESANSTEYWQHYLIADTGNKRLVEVIDRFYYDPTTGLIGQPVTVGTVPQVGVLLWHSPATASGRNYSYSSISRVKVPDASTGHYVYVCGIGGTLPTRVGNGLDVPTPASTVDAKDGSGGIVIYDPTNQSGVVTIDSISWSDYSNLSFWDPVTQVFDNLAQTGTAASALAYKRRQGGTYHFSNLNSVTAKTVSDGSAVPKIAIMVCDATGVYEGLYDPTAPTTTTLGVDWMMPNEVFRNIQQGTNGSNQAYPTSNNAQDLRALFARRLDSGEVLIVNGYYGLLQDGVTPFTGEVMQVSGTTSFTQANLGFNSGSITLDLRTAGSTAFRGLLMPVFADRR
jgi:hypothetical protein